MFESCRGRFHREISGLAYVIMVGRSIFPLVAILAAMAYAAGADCDVRALHIGLKMTPALAMAAAVLWQRKLAAWAVVLALMLQAAGDGLLELGGSWFLAGMAAFFLGHWAYIAAFLPYRYGPGTLPRYRFAMIAVLVVVMLALTIYIWPMLSGPLVVASPVYSAALTAMAVSALFGRWRGLGVVLGALLFVVSDVALGLKLFAHLDAVAWLVWPTYVAAQVLMPVGYLQTAGATDARPKALFA